MQRLLATLLLSIIGLLPINSAWVEASAPGNMPACCRASGKHHCAMKTSGEKPGLRSIADQCPCPAAISSAAVSVTVFPVPVSSLSFRAKASSYLPPAQSGILFHAAFDRSGQKRGPPSFS